MDTGSCLTCAFIETYHLNRVSLEVALFIQQILVKCPLQDIPTAKDTAKNQTAEVPTSVELTF